MQRQAVTWLVLFAILGAVSANDALANPFMKSESLPAVPAVPAQAVVQQQVSAPSAPLPTPSFSEVASKIVLSKQEQLQKEAEEEFKREMELIKQHAVDLTYQRTGKAPSQAPSSPSLLEKASAETQVNVQLRQGTEIGEKTVVTELGEVKKVHYGHGVFNRMRINQAKQANQAKEVIAAPQKSTPTPIQPASNVPNFRFRSWSPPTFDKFGNPINELHGFRPAPGLASSFLAANEEVQASAEEQAKLEAEVAQMEASLLETSATSKHEEALAAEEQFENESEEEFFNAGNSHSEIQQVNAEVENDMKSLVETDVDLEEQEEEEHLNSNAAGGHALPESPRPAFDAKISLNKPISLLETASMTSTTNAPVNSGFPAAPEHPGWPFLDPMQAEGGVNNGLAYQPPDVTQMPGPNGYGNLNSYESHPFDSLLNERPPESDRLQVAGADPFQVNRGIATGPNALDVPVPYFPSQNPPPLAPMDKPAAVSATFVQGTPSQYIQPAMRPFSNQHELLGSRTIQNPVSGQLAPPMGQGWENGPGLGTNKHGMLEMRMMETQARTNAQSGYAFPVPHNQNEAIPATIQPAGPGQSQMAFPYQVTTGAVANSEFLRMPRQVPGFYGDQQLPHASWAQVGHVEPSLLPVDYMSDTPYFPAQSVGPAFPPAAISQPVNAAGGAAGPRGYGGSMPFAPYLQMQA